MEYDINHPYQHDTKYPLRDVSVSMINREISYVISPNLREN